MKIGIICEGKKPPDSRVALTPQQCAEIQTQYDVEFIIEPSPTRCISDAQYKIDKLLKTTVLCVIEKLKALSIEPHLQEVIKLKGIVKVRSHLFIMS
jgi:hypothetical protein